MLRVKDSDAALVARARQGDQAAFEQLVRKHQRYAFNVAYRVLQDTAEAEDATQEAFVRAWRGLPGFRGQSRFTTWLYRIIYNLCLNRLPKLRHELLQVEPLEDMLDDSTPSPPDLFETQEQMTFLHAELERMPKKYRLVLSLRYLQHLSYEEIATALDVPMGTVKTHIHRARRLLADRARQWEEETLRASPQGTQASAPSSCGNNTATRPKEDPKGLDRSMSYALP
jgi:RNA polymerase sigma-70 factor (ECF subfamily)